MNTKLIQSTKWVPVAVFVWTGVGCLLFPLWWYQFLFEAGWHSKQWVEGLAAVARWVEWVVVRQFLQEPINIVILVAIVIGVRIALKRGLLESPAIGPATWKHQVAAAALLLVGLLSAWLTGQSGEHARSRMLLPTDLQRGASDRASVSEVRDFAYIDAPRVTSLFEQVLPTMQLSEIQTERSMSGSAEGKVGVDKVASVKAGVTSGQKATERYQSTPLTAPRQVAELLKYFTDKNDLGNYESLEVDSQQLRALNTLADLLRQYQIAHDSRRLNEVTMATLQRTVDEQQSRFSSLRMPLVVRGAFEAIVRGDTIEMSHMFFVRENMIAIRFLVEPFPRTSSNVLSNSIRQLTATATTLQLAVFGRVMSVQRDSGELKIVVSPYAAWHL